MEVIKTATEWAKAEVFSTRFFIFFAAAFLLGSAGFWQLGKTELARAYVVPLLVTGGLLLTIGLGLLFTNKARINQFQAAYERDASAFIALEIARAESTIKEYGTVFKVIPIIIVVAALLMIFIHTPVWRAICISTIAMMVVILLVDGTAAGRMEAYHKQLLKMEKTKDF